MSRLVIVSNRVADLRKSSQSGGLAVGLADALRERGGVWFGWNGETISTRPSEVQIEEIGKVRTIGTPLRQKDYKEYYIGYANSVLWPLFHYRLDLVSYRPAFYEGYSRVNRQFASQLAPHLKPDDIVWIHDYHLIPMARALRDLGCRQRIGFFLHIPFPPLDLMSASPNHRALVEALLQYDVVGFQTSTDVTNFRHAVEEWQELDSSDEGSVTVGGRRIVVARYPIGVDARSFRTMAEQSPDEVAIDSARRRVLGRKQIVGVDRLDYSKGLPDRFRAFSRLLTLHPELEKRVTFLQVAPPTREDVDAYSDIRQELEGLAGSINGRFSDFNWTPLRYIHRPVPREMLAALFRASSVGLVTPLRDGMNLVAKEYVAAQDEADPGVLVLSKFAGAAEDMTDALIVNPYDIDSMAEAINTALHMPLEERRRRHASLLKHVVEQSAEAWLRAFLADLELDGATATPPSGTVIAANAA